QAALVGGQRGAVGIQGQGIRPGIEGRAARQWRHSLGWTAVLAQRGEPRVERAGSRAGEIGGSPSACAVSDADEVVALRTESVGGDIGAGAGGLVAGDY